MFGHNQAAQNGWLATANRGKLAEEKVEEKTEAEEEGGDLWGKLVELI